MGEREVFEHLSSVAGRAVSKLPDPAGSFGQDRVFGWTLGAPASSTLKRTIVDGVEVVAASDVALSVCHDSCRGLN